MTPSHYRQTVNFLFFFCSSSFFSSSFFSIAVQPKYTHTKHTHTHARTHARTHAHTHTHTYARTHAHARFFLLWASDLIVSSGRCSMARFVPTHHVPTPELGYVLLQRGKKKKKRWETCMHGLSNFQRWNCNRHRAIVILTTSPHRSPKSSQVERCREKDNTDSVHVIAGLTAVGTGPDDYSCAVVNRVVYVFYGVLWRKVLWRSGRFPCWPHSWFPAAVWVCVLWAGC